VTGRPCVSVIVPFAGAAEDLGRLLVALGELRIRSGDQLIVADNRPGVSPTSAADTGAVELLAAPGARSPGRARNRGAQAASGEWLVFIDADTTPSPSLLDNYFEPVPDPSTAILAGGITDVAGGTDLASRYTAARGHLSQDATLHRGDGTPYAQTANCAVRASAFRSVGGFVEDIRAGEDADLCFRLQAAGWTLEERPRAGVEHRGRAGLRALLGQLAVHGGGASWLNRRYPGEFPSPTARDLAGRSGRGLIETARRLARGEPEGASAALLDAVCPAVFDLGRLGSNRARGRT
jgi:mycofactocin glycosyltransferase